MRRLSKILLLFLATNWLSSSYAANNMNLLIMIEDADTDAIPRNNLINKRVHARITQQLNQVVDVYDETSITLDTFKSTRQGRTDAELLDIARSITRPPIDLVLVFSTYASVDSSMYAKNARARVTGRILNANSGKFLDNFEVQSPRTWTISSTCNNRTCRLEELGNEAKVLGDELGVVLAEKLNWLLSDNSSAILANDYYLQFDGFSAQEVAKIEEYLLVFSGYVSHRPTQQRYTRTTLLYRSSIGTAKLNRNLLNVIEELNMRAMINFEGNGFNIKRITLRGETSSRDVTEGW